MCETNRLIVGCHLVKPFFVSEILTYFRYRKLLQCRHLSSYFSEINCYFDLKFWSTIRSRYWPHWNLFGVWGINNHKQSQNSFSSHQTICIIVKNINFSFRTGWIEVHLINTFPSNIVELHNFLYTEKGMPITNRYL